MQLGVTLGFLHLELHCLRKARHEAHTGLRR
jgi:hypothetical protein